MFITWWCDHKSKKKLAGIGLPLDECYLNSRQSDQRQVKTEMLFNEASFLGDNFEQFYSVISAGEGGLWNRRLKRIVRFIEMHISHPMKEGCHLTFLRVHRQFLLKVS